MCRFTITTLALALAATSIAAQQTSLTPGQIATAEVEVPLLVRSWRSSPG